MELDTARYLAIGYMELNGLIDKGWRFRFNRNKRRLGVCKQDEMLIELSEHYVTRNEQEHVKDTILHEVAHAIVGTEHGHDDVWKEMCIQLGCQPFSCSATAKMPEGYWQARCPGCFNTFTRHRRPRRLRGRYCVACGPERGQLVFADIRVAQKSRRAAQEVKEIPATVASTTPKQLVLKLMFG